MRVLGIYRERVFSPGKVQTDAAILDATLAELACQGYTVAACEAEALDRVSDKAAWVLSMAQSSRTLDVLEGWRRKGSRIVNSVTSVRNCYRKVLIRLLTEAGFPLPASRFFTLAGLREAGANLSPPFWLKRGDVHAMQPGDVVQMNSTGELSRALDHFQAQKVEEVLVQEHVRGQVVKFYGVGPGEYFSAFLEATGEEVTSGLGSLPAVAEQAAEVLGLQVYGGDAIVTQTGEMVLVDFNDWPSFSRCCQPAARSIARHVTRLIDGGFHVLSKCC